MESSRNIEAKVKCSLCEKYLHKSSVKIHIKTVHCEIKEYECVNCNKKFGQKPSLYLHIRNVHEGERSGKCEKRLNENVRFECDVCEKSYKDTSSLRHHYKFSHEKRSASKYDCELCGGQFEDLKRHVIRAHGDQKPHVCNLCQMSFSVTTYLTKHMKLHHQRQEKSQIE